MTVYIENLRKSTKKLVEPIKCKIKGHKRNKQKSIILPNHVTLMRMNKWKLKNKIFTIVFPFKNERKRIKYTAQSQSLGKKERKIIFNYHFLYCFQPFYLLFPQMNGKLPKGPL